jgi:diadenosine tetraphosphate (Ap4A) HIT family hydrolase
MKQPNAEFFYEDPQGLFIAKWDLNPERPGHALVIPKRHVQFFHELNEKELEMLGPAVEKAEEIILKTNLMDMYETVFPNPPTGLSLKFISEAKQMLKSIGNIPPDGFNDGINDGPTAGQSVHHLHWHIMPRWKGDVPDPDGGMRHMFDSSDQIAGSSGKNGAEL